MGGKEAAKIVYTTDRNNKSFLNNQIPGIVDESEIRDEFNGTLSIHKKNIRKTIKEKFMVTGKRTLANRLSPSELIAQFTLIINSLLGGQKTREEMFNILTPNAARTKENFRRIDNVLSRAQKTSLLIIYPNRSAKKWCIQTLSQTTKDLAEEMFRNMNLAYKSISEIKKIKGIETPGKNVRLKKVKPTKDQPVLHVPPLQISINGGSQEPIIVPINLHVKLKITVEVITS